jgi:hypothetical protein
MCAAIHFYLHAKTNSHKKARRIVERLRQRTLDLPFKEVSEIVELSGDACDPHHDQPDYDLRALVEGAGRLVIASEVCRVVAPEKIIAFSAWPGNGRGVCNLGLARYPATVVWSGRTICTGIRGWSWNSFCQTSFASEEKNGGIPNVLRCHLTVAKMLDYTAELGILQGVFDLTGYWEHRDIKRLEADLQHFPAGPADARDGTGDADECYF